MDFNLFLLSRYTHDNNGLRNGFGKSKFVPPLVASPFVLENTNKMSIIRQNIIKISVIRSTSLYLLLLKA